MRAFSRSGEHCLPLREAVETSDELQPLGVAAAFASGPLVLQLPGGPEVQPFRWLDGR